MDHIYCKHIHEKKTINLDNKENNEVLHICEDCYNFFKHYIIISMDED